MEQVDIVFDPVTHIGVTNTPTSAEIGLDMKFLLPDVGVSVGDVITVDTVVTDGVSSLTSSTTFTVAPVVSTPSEVC